MGCIQTIGEVVGQSHAPVVEFGGSMLSPFGDIVTAPITPLLQMDFIYGLNTQTSVSTVANGGSADTSGGRLRLQSGTASNGSAIFRSRRPARYRPGQGIIARFTPVFTAGVANSTQLMGPGSDADGYFFGYNGATFGILHRNAGSDTWIPQTTWNGDRCNGSGASRFTWTPSNGNVCMVRYPFLGYGDITFWVQDTDTARWILCHTIRYSGTSAVLQLGNPSLFFYAQTLNAGNTSNLTAYCGSVGFFLCGERQFIGSPKWAQDSSKSSITAETNLLSLRNATTYNGVANRALLRLTSVSFGSNAASGNAALRMRIGATVGGVPVFTPINGSTADNGVTIASGNSAASYDTAGTTATGGTYFHGVSISNGGGGQTVDLTPYNYTVVPGEILTISGFSTISSAMACTLTWVEDV